MQVHANFERIFAYRSLSKVEKTGRIRFLLIYVVNWTYVLFFDTAAAIQDDKERDQSTSLMNFLKHFNQNRHHVANPKGKQKARDFIEKTFKDLGLITWSESFKPDFPQVRFKLSFYWVRIEGNDDFSAFLYR